jgi:hypothetical protein
MAESRPQSSLGARKEKMNGSRSKGRGQFACATTALFSVRPMKEISIQNSLQHLVQLSNIKNLQEFCRLYFSSILCGDKKTKKKKPIGRQSK